MLKRFPQLVESMVLTLISFENVFAVSLAVFMWGAIISGFIGGCLNSDKATTICIVLLGLVCLELMVLLTWYTINVGIS